MTTRENNDIPRKGYSEQPRYSFHHQHSEQLEHEDHDVRRNGKNRQDLGGMTEDHTNIAHPKVHQQHLDHKCSSRIITQLCSKINQRNKDYNLTIYLHQISTDMSYILDIDLRKGAN